MTQGKEPQEQIVTLEREIKTFADSLPYWAQYLSANILLSNSVTQADIDAAYSYLLEDGGLQEKSKRPSLNIDCSCYTACTHKTDLILSEIKDVEGVNALVEGQSITFSPAVTIIYGVNGSGKTGYIRILKKAFFSKAGEQILPNVHITGGHKKVNANFVFQSSGKPYTLGYPDDADQIEFEQFAVFDVKSVSIHLNNKNQFEFRPAGLNFFSELTKAYKQIEDRIQAEIEIRSVPKDYAGVFDGESEIKTFLESLSARTNVEDLKKHGPLTEEEKQKKNGLEEEKARLLTLKKDKEIEELDNIKKLIENLKLSIDDNNELLCKKTLSEVNALIRDCAAKEALAKKEGVAGFTTDVLKHIGGAEWKAFIEAASEFAKQQDRDTYPKTGDPCLLCHQPLTEKAAKLVASYWAFLRSQAELDAKTAQGLTVKKKESYEKLTFSLLPEDGVLTKWFKENYPEVLKTANTQLLKQKSLADSVISAIKTNTPAIQEEVIFATSVLVPLITDVENRVKSLIEKDPGKQIESINKELTYLLHRGKLQEHIEHIEDYTRTLRWAETAKVLRRQLNTRKITDKEKDLSDRYFGQSYMAAFKDECDSLDGNFGISVKHTGASGISYRELKIKDRTPSDVLSEGEQKVISLADFLSEVRLSEVNRGIIFDDPVNSLDEQRKSNIANRLVSEARSRQVIIFTHDLVFLSSIIGYCEEFNTQCECHWIEEVGGKPGTVWLGNVPSFEKAYKKSGKAQEYCEKAKGCGPEERENLLKSGFAALRTSYEALVVFDLFEGVVQRFNERVSIDSLSSVYFDVPMRDEIVDSFYKCCRFMEGHSHSDKYAYKKPDTQDLQNEIQRFTDLKKKLKDLKKAKGG